MGGYIVQMMNAFFDEIRVNGYVAQFINGKPVYFHIRVITMGDKYVCIWQMSVILRVDKVIET